MGPVLFEYFSNQITVVIQGNRIHVDEFKIGITVLKGALLL